MLLDPLKLGNTIFELLTMIYLENGSMGSAPDLDGGGLGPRRGGRPHRICR